MFDTVVVGGGLGGLVAGVRLQELDLSALVLEKGAEDGGLNNARISGGLIHLAWGAMDEGRDILRERLETETDGEIDPVLADVLADNAGRAIEWIHDLGIATQAKSDVIYQRHALYPHRPGTGRRIRPEFGPDRMITTLYRTFRESGGTIELDASVTDLQRDATTGTWTVTYRSGDGSPDKTVTARSVVVADGGFQANAELLSRYVGPNAGLCALRAMTSATGDGLQMMLAAGAGATGLGRVYGHMVSINALVDDEFWPYPALDKLCLQGALVARDGALFEHVTSTGVELVTLLARAEDPRGYAVVFDDDLWNTAGRDNPYNTAVPNPDLVDRGGHFVSADSLDDLAKELGVDPAVLSAAVEAHNAQPTRRPITQAPFHAARVVPGITFTMGGVLVDGDANVLTPDRHPIPGLFATGSTVGGVHGGPHGGYVGGLAVAIELGLVAAESIAQADQKAGA
ncbi:FAD-dependent oxidoreductase [Aeromicrobium wangtongii]|uniref:FAD-dependent oxidoreductase n=1 Tax=Aeromicrobium wangtongii TaxID=2969247 RepID=UPI002017CCC5|nr:FAD-dependent oxidoreductase [Aeromicrobium wangtongii]MCL3819384.1 FAD-dependent oxidoreductase [Aeromicrobium wangtongii]